MDNALVKGQLTIQLQEPNQARYIYIDPTTNKVRLLMPIVGGTEIGTDNTCMTTAALIDFFGRGYDKTKSAIYSLTKYKAALESDIASLSAHLIRDQKSDRLTQINNLIEDVKTVVASQQLSNLNFLPPVVERFMNQPSSNLFSVSFRPRKTDSIGAPKNSACSFQRSDDPYNPGLAVQSNVEYAKKMKNGLPKSFMTEFSDFDLTTRNDSPSADRILLANVMQKYTQNNVVGVLNKTDYEALTKNIKECAAAAFGCGQPVTTDYNDVKSALNANANTTIEDWAESAISGISDFLASENVKKALKASASPFYTKLNNNDAGRDQLSIITQLCLAEINTYCISDGIVTKDKNFGAIIDGNAVLRDKIPQLVKEALISGGSVEEALINFVNTNQVAFFLKLILNKAAQDKITKKFEGHYDTIKAAPHFDNFIIREAAKNKPFVSHQGSICADFLSFVANEFPITLNSQLVQQPIPSDDSGIVAPTNQHVIFVQVVKRDDLFINIMTLAQKSVKNDTTSAQKVYSYPTLPNAVKLLLSKVKLDGKECCFFEILTEKEIESLRTIKSFGLLKYLAQQDISDSGLLSKFNENIARESQVVLNNSDIKALHVVAVEKFGSEKCPKNYSSHENVKKLLELLNIKGPIVSDGGHNRFLVQIDSASNKALEDAKKLGAGKIHLSPTQASRLYKEVKSRYGEASGGYQSMNLLTNTDTGNKLKETLRLLHITTTEISFPNQGKGTDGYVLALDAVNASLIEGVMHNQSRMHLTREMAGRIYKMFADQNPHIDLSQFDDLSVPRKIEFALESLGLPHNSLSFNGIDGYLVNVSEEIENFISNPNCDSFETAKDQITGLDGLRSRGPRLDEGTLLTTLREFAIQTAAQPITGLGGRMVSGPQAMAAALSAVAAAPAPVLAVKKVVACRLETNGKPKPVTKGNDITLNCPANILAEFKKLLADTKILGAKFTNPYTDQEEQIPSDPKDLTARHLQILARNERYNTTGVMQVSLYSGLLSDDKIASLRCLVKATNVAGIVDVVGTGGYKSTTMPLSASEEKRAIVIDQSGLQWQNDFRNTGGMFFYPDNSSDLKLPANYSAWQKDMFLAMYEKDRPACSDKFLTTTWNSVKGKIDLNQVTFAIKAEFTQAILAASSAGKSLKDSDKICFKFLKAGMGFFADGINQGANLKDLENARMQGIYLALEEISKLPDANHKKEILGKISRIELPFSQDSATISTLVKVLGLEWGGVAAKDALKPVPGYVIATTNCGDPHAMFGNEGGHSSVDASMSTNIGNPNALNPCCNKEMLLAVTSNSASLSSKPVAAAVAAIAPAPKAVAAAVPAIAPAPKVVAAAAVAASKPQATLDKDKISVSAYFSRDLSNIVVQFESADLRDKAKNYAELLTQNSYTGNGLCLGYIGGRVIFPSQKCAELFGPLLGIRDDATDNALSQEIKNTLAFKTNGFTVIGGKGDQLNGSILLPKQQVVGVAAPAGTTEEEELKQAIALSLVAPAVAPATAVKPATAVAVVQSQKQAKISLAPDGSLMIKFSSSQEAEGFRNQFAKDKMPLELGNGKETDICFLRKSTKEGDLGVYITANNELGINFANKDIKNAFSVAIGMNKQHYDDYKDKPTKLFIKPTVLDVKKESTSNFITNPPKPFALQSSKACSIL